MMKRSAPLASLLAVLTLGISAHARAAGSAPIKAIGIENEYADIIAQVGGRFVAANAIETDPNTDPHAFEASPRIARALAGAALVVINGVGYDGWARKIMAASPRPSRKVINVQTLLHLPDDTPNPHLWYAPRTMPAVARAVADALSALDPAQARAFHRNAETVVASLAPWTDAIASFRAAHGGTPIAVTEPVADDLLEAMGFRILTPFTLQKAIMDGTDPSPQDVTAQTGFFTGHQVKLFAYNQQVTDTLTRSFLDASKKAGIPVVGVYETMPTPGYTYQTWMIAEVAALERAVTADDSTETLQRAH